MPIQIDQITVRSPITAKVPLVAHVGTAALGRHAGWRRADVDCRRHGQQTSLTRTGTRLPAHFLADVDVRGLPVRGSRADHRGTDLILMVPVEVLYPPRRPVVSRMIKRAGNKTGAT
jgi:hypothetical protein